VAPEPTPRTVGTAASQQTGKLRHDKLRPATLFASFQGDLYVVRNPNATATFSDEQHVTGSATLAWAVRSAD